MQRGWGYSRSYSNPPGYYAQEGTWGHEQEEEEPTLSSNTEDESDFPGLVSIAAEFLFGSSTFLHSKPSSKDKWRLRALVIASKPSGIISIKEILPYVDSPPSDKSLSPSSSVYYGLSIVSHFNGKPISSSNDDDDDDNALFYFPEVIAESECGGLPSPSKVIMENSEDDISGLSSILYKSNNTNHEYIPLRLTSSSSSTNIPKYLKEQKHTLTQLTSKNFYTCLSLGIINYIGIYWLKTNAIVDGGILELSSSIFGLLLQYLISFLYFYSKLFLLLPCCRLVIVVIMNFMIDGRNRRRVLLVEGDNEG